MHDMELGKFFPYDTSRPRQLEVASRVYSARLVKAAQALGRAPRPPEDRVVCILADKPFSEGRLLSRFPSWIRNNCRGVCDNYDDLIREVERFYSDGSSHE